jgi:hypothetical protein
MAAVAGMETTQMMRQVLLEEGVFKGAANADADLLDMFWQARASDEYRERLRTVSIRIEDPPSPIVCHRCGRSDPGIDELTDFPDEPEVGALRAGWRYDEEYLWMCRQCLGERHCCDWGNRAPSGRRFLVDYSP